MPQIFSYLFRGREKILSSHQAYDQGAAGLARRLAGRLDSSLYLGSISRLLIDLNRSPSNRKSLYSSYSNSLDKAGRELLIKKYYEPYRKRLEEEVAAVIGRGRPILHISVHSFAPVKNGKVRQADIGLLYDPARNVEKDMCAFLVGFFQKNMVSIRLRRNYPYLGKTDGFTSFLRRIHTVRFYAGIEVEVNQALIAAGGRKKHKAEDLLAEGFKHIMKMRDFARFTEWLVEAGDGY